MTTANRRTGSPTRRQVLAAGAAAGTAAWVAPSILSVDAVAAATDVPPGAGSIDGVVTYCGNPINEQEPFQVSASRVGGGGTGTDTTDLEGVYEIFNLPNGTYDITILPLAGGPPQVFPAAVTVNGNAANFNPDYTEAGC
jgi:hypothetical protein